MTTFYKQHLLTSDIRYKCLLNDLVNSPDYVKVKSGNFRVTDKVQFYCNKHGLYSQIIRNHLRGTSCPKCSKELRHLNNRKHLLFSDNRYQSLFNDCSYESKQVLLSGSFNNETKLLFICNKHGLYSQTVHAHLTGQSCPRCARTEGTYGSKIEFQIQSLLAKEGYTFNKVIGLIKSPVSGKSMELDLYDPSTKIAIEVNGSYWHSVEHMSKSKGYYTPQSNPIYYHRMKSQLCENQGITLFHFFEGVTDIDKFITNITNYNSKCDFSKKSICLDRASQPIASYLSNGYKIISESEPTCIHEFSINSTTYHVFDAGKVNLIKYDNSI